MKKYDIIMNGTPLNEYEMDGIYGGDNEGCTNRDFDMCTSVNNNRCLNEYTVKTVKADEDKPANNF